MPCKGNTRKPGATPPEQIVKIDPTPKGSYKVA